MRSTILSKLLGASIAILVILFGLTCCDRDEGFQINYYIVNETNSDVEIHVFGTTDKSLELNVKIPSKDTASFSNGSQSSFKLFGLNGVDSTVVVWPNDRFYLFDETLFESIYKGGIKNYYYIKILDYQNATPLTN